MLAELSRILRRTKFARAISVSGLTLDELVLGYAELATLAAPAPIAPTIRNDPDDDHVLACAVAAEADVIVGGDRHLLALKSYRQIQIVGAAAALLLIAQ